MLTLHLQNLFLPSLILFLLFHIDMIIHWIVLMSVPYFHEP